MYLQVRKDDKQKDETSIQSAEEGGANSVPAESMPLKQEKENEDCTPKENGYVKAQKSTDV